MNDSKNIQEKDWIIIAIVLVVAILLFIITFGQVDTLKNHSKLSLEERKKLAADRNRRLLGLIEKKIKLKRKLDKRFRLAYLSVRIMFVTLWFSLNALFYYHYGITDCMKLLKYNEMFLLGVLTLNFISFGTVTNLKSMLDYFKNKLENWVYKKYVNIDQQIEKHEKESDDIKGLLDGEGY